MKIHDRFTLGSMCKQASPNWMFSDITDHPKWLAETGVFALKTYGFVHDSAVQSTLSITSDASLKEDNYRLEITSLSDVLITANNRRALRYALETLRDSVVLREGACHLPVMRVKDGPDFAVRGFIEGFYGEPWSHATRLKVIETLAAWRYNAYFYAPKDDRYHRDLWRLPYPEEKRLELLELKSACDAQAIDFHFGISPGKDFNPCLEENYEALYRKIDQVIEHGVRHIVLLFDDIEPVLDEATVTRFKRAGIVHASVANALYDYLKTRLDQVALTVCPTEYSHVGTSVYREDFGHTLVADIPVFFTGHNVVAEVLDVDDVIATQKAYGRELAIWDNFPVNDFLTARLFLGPLRNRDSHLAKHVNIMVMNPMNQAHASLVSLATASLYMWNSGAYCPDTAYDQVLEQLMPASFREAYRIFASWHQESALEKDDDVHTIEALSMLETAAKTLLSWDVPLREELQPWLNLALEVCDWLKRLEAGENVDVEIRRYIEQPYAFGNRTIDLHLEKCGRLDETDRNTLNRKARGTVWWRVFEDKLGGKMS